MRRTRVRTLAAVAVGVAAVGLLLLRLLESRGIFVPGAAWVEVAALVLLAGLVLWAGWAVRSYLRGDRPDLDPLRAARTFAMAKAAAYTGALLAGRYVASVLLVLPQLDVEPRREVAVTSGVAALAAVGLAVVGLVVEKFCEAPPPEEDDGTEAVPS
ncbi:MULTISPECIES: DUF3180 domain-containing protein [Isoptericola]|uniref:DUF3180 domain-containing protein n=1 Tax=Isoptericola sediminis TaxID=2733572 RepID=A0A849K1D8_9MICO|nr:MULTISPECIES: DUF3180 domain-containing protein [unclassified Isoptericola]MDO8149288.1 DUF3180 domain-containing protein [Isoptericola sp. b515]MDO8152227.1 DUF3180 domain-containing protein [Isoptericola sp. b408]NNU26060.1 DUF3180 domain-containing protein [Isoptericola sediminis]